MIRSRQDLLYYLDADRIALRVQGSWKDFFFHDVWRFEKYLRKNEYYTNCKPSSVWIPYKLFLKIRFRLLSVKLGYTIPLNVFGPGLSIEHRGTLIVSNQVKVGKNCRIHNCVYLSSTHEGGPTIGDNVYIGPGAKLYGPITIADDIAIGANAVVNKSFLEPGISIAGIPAKKISDKGSSRLLVRATEILDKKSVKELRRMKQEISFVFITLMIEWIDLIFDMLGIPYLT